MDAESFVLTNVRMALADRVIDGWVAIDGGRIAEIGEGRAPERGLDLGGDYLIPGLIELHTDHLEAHASPRPGVNWDAEAATLAYDRQMIASGITTVFDSLRVGADTENDRLAGQLETLASAIDAMRDRDLLCAEHLTHLRCEIAAPDVVANAAQFLERRRVQLMSLMDHTPGQRQFRDLPKMRAYYGRHYGLRDDAAFADFVQQRLALHEKYAAMNRRALVELAHRNGAALASHDDATAEQAAEAIADRVSIAEFPTTVEAAKASHAAGVKVMMGAPNIVRGGSHSGNIAAEELAAAGALDILSSDYVPASLLMAAFELPDRQPHIDLAQAIRLVSKNPAEATGLSDRGEIAPGKRADLAQIRALGHRPATIRVWREGRRVA
ncbi:MAG TPA: alpha-D-ribose 1-methylphosphonate 5-triphosphate diphosphatase [Roseiarcus sp.]|nr:alpha-D-ribose 1-methylphosphonate 5-triphosphate diphosphatase [Roseiarcus sp.]